jgi:hypothetical protein
VKEEAACEESARAVHGDDDEESVVVVVVRGGRGVLLLVATVESQKEGRIGFVGASESPFGERARRAGAIGTCAEGFLRTNPPPTFSTTLAAASYSQTFELMVGTTIESFRGGKRITVTAILPERQLDAARSVAPQE